MGGAGGGSGGGRHRPQLRTSITHQASTPPLSESLIHLFSHLRALLVESISNRLSVAHATGTGQSLGLLCLLCLCLCVCECLSVSARCLMVMVVCVMVMVVVSTRDEIEGIDLTYLERREERVKMMSESHEATLPYEPELDIGTDTCEREERSIHQPTTDTGHLYR